MVKKNIAILGSTGSVGTQTLEVARHDHNLNIVGLTTNTNIDLLEKQIIEFEPELVCVMNEQRALELSQRLAEKSIHVEVVSGLEGLIEVATLDNAHLVVTAVIGMIGLVPTVEAIKKGKHIALANKETLVAGGDIVMKLANAYNIPILPIDSEHSAIFQCLQGNKREEVSRYILTASGGPFRDFTYEQLQKVTVQDALKHPNWEMGSKITIDSATLMNKGLEVIEGKHLFNTSYDKIDVVVHRESIIHSMVEYRDGSTMAQLGYADMKVPIAYAIYYPNRQKANHAEKLDFCKLKSLTFEEPKRSLFPCLDLGYSALKTGGTMPAVLNAANEIAVESFLNKKISFLQIPKLIAKVMEKHTCISEPTLDEILYYDNWAREYSRKKVKESGTSHL
ncbi:MAG: 1-deoxy-D-xylulose-5-phosphate reductoisomerase [Clostridia bacterium]|jgi:1-deoxy-D-xylulose-5-phosphate reductoisomerase|nr:1-deoxy-D-xylulose-5-phosphate reductoisomerase [Clostridia bacterium]